MKQPFCPVILAGGRGTRFWPVSRRARPKPLVRLEDGPTLLEQAWGRARRLAPPDDIFVAMDASLEGPVREMLPELGPDQAIVESERRDTGPAAVHAAWFIRQRKGPATLALMPADHMIRQVDVFVEAMQEARRAAEEHRALICLGVPPQGPSSAYGYVEHTDSLVGRTGSSPVSRFVEKPDADRARELLQGGHCLWNAGIFVWGAERFLEEVERVCPELAAPVALLQKGDAASFFAAAPRVAVDRAVLERSRNVRVVAADMGWDDLGDWESLARRLPADADGNVGEGLELAVGSRDCVVHSPGKPVVLLGVDGLVVVECEDVVLVARRDAGQELRDIPELLERRGRRDLT
jgi:mannose-1-phosphate guanylyltransferase/mannose-6-phosphate isomerase